MGWAQSLNLNFKQDVQFRKNRLCNNKGNSRRSDKGFQLRYRFILKENNEEKNARYTLYVIFIQCTKPTFVLQEPNL